jgi:hypothetical protein
MEFAIAAHRHGGVVTDELTLQYLPLTKPTPANWFAGWTFAW